MVSVELRQRVASGAALIALALGALFLGPLTSALLIAAICVGGCNEWITLQQPPRRKLFIAISIVCVLLMLGMGYTLRPVAGALLGVVLMLLLFVFAARVDFDRAGWIALVVPYMGGGCLALLAIRLLPDHGLSMTLYLLLVVWATDIGAYFAGRHFGGPKLLPQVSPSKTWSGLLGGMAAAGSLAFCYAKVQSVHLPELATGLALVLAVVAQLGDLFESYVKRRVGVKDSGRLIPGHGGVLDRIDGLIFAALFLIMFQAIVGEEIAWW